MILACSSRFLEGNFFQKPLAKSEQRDPFRPGKLLKVIEHYSYSSSIAKDHYLYILGAVALQTQGPFDSPVRIKRLSSW